MNCFPCFSSQKSKKETHDTSGDNLVQSKVPDNLAASAKPVEQANLPIQTFNFREIAAATRNFRQEFLLGEGGFGKVYKGTLQATGQVVAVKQLDRHSLQETREFLAEVGQLCQLQHPNLINLIGYCADGDQRLLVYEYMPGGSLPDHLFDLKPDRKPMEWVTRMKIAYGAAQALEYLHDKANPPVIYRDLKSLNVLLDEGYNPKLSDIGLSKLGPSAEKLPMQSRVMGTYGYSAPEYSRSGRLTTTADVYSFGVVLLELITGRKAIDTTKPVDEQNLVTWAQPIFKEPKKFPEMADPLLKKRFPERGLNQVVAIAAMCLQDESAARPLMSDVVTALSFLSMATEENNIPPTLPASISSKLHCISTKLHMQFMEHGDEGPLMKKEQSTVKDQQRKEQSSIQEEETDSESESDSDSDQDENEDDEVQDPQQGRARSSSSSSVSGDEKSASSNEGSAYYREESRKDSNACSGEESSRSSANNTSGSTKFNDASFSRSHKDSRESVGKDAYVSSSSSSDSEESDSHSHKRSSRKMKDKRNSPSPKSHKEPQDGNIPLRGDRSKKSSDAEPESVSVSNKSSWNSEDGNDYIESNRSGELIDENVSTSQKTSKEPKTRKSSGEGAPKGRKGNKKSSPREGNDSPNGNKKSSDETRKNNRKSQHNSSKVPNDESNASSSSPSSGKSNRKRTKKVDNSPGSSTSSVESQQEGSETSQSPNQQQQPATFTKASKVSF